MKHHPASTNGFALVIALSLMAFILLLILSITTLVRVETQSANIQLGQLEARMNAQLGAMVALGDLQRYTGPDQRVTARADILLAPGVSGPAGQQKWTGVWSSKETTNDPLDAVDGLGGRQARWLVSGNETNGLIIDSNIPLSTDTVGLATASTGPGTGSVNDYGGLLDLEGNVIDRDDTVKAPKVEILGYDNALAGHYAYWVSDEGVKARVNMAEPSWDDNDDYSVEERSYFRTAMAQVADPTAVSNSDGDQLLAGSNSRWKDGSGNPGKIGSLKNIPMFLEGDLPGVDLSDVSREFFHDFTVHSSGVLANTKDGGLKRDLSTALLDDLPSDMKEGGANSPMFPPANGPSGPGQMNPGGPKWEQLSDYYNLAYDNSKKVSDEPIPLRMPTNEQVGFTPVITRSNFFVQGFAERNSAREASGNWCDNTDPGTLPGSDWEDWENSNSDWYRARGYRYSLGMFPLITLWNPYDRDMILGDLGLEFELPKIDIVDRPGSTTSVAAVGNYTSKWNGAEGVKRWTVKFVIQGGSLQDGVLKAGEAVNFSPPTNATYNAFTPTDNLLVARASAPFVNGFFTPPVASNSNAAFWENLAQLATNSASWSKSRLSLNFSGGKGSLWRQLVMLYSSADIGTGNQFISENRFKTIDVHGTGVFQQGWQQPRVILANRLMGMGPFSDYNLHIKNSGVSSSNPNYQDPFGIIKIYDANTSSYITQFRAFGPGTSYFSDFVGPQGDSQQNIKLGSTDEIEGNKLSDDGLSGYNPWGAAGAMRFPNVPIRTWANTGSESEIHLFLNMNPTAPVIHKEPNITWDESNDTMAESNVYSKGHVRPWVNNEEADYYDYHIASGTDELQARVGFSNTLSDGSERMVLFEVPDNIPLSIGQLAHANLMNFDVFSDGSSPAIGNCIPGNGDKWNSHTLQTYATPTYAIGNSLASPFLPLASTEEWFSSVRRPWVSVPAAHYDYSYKLNDALWDGYFFSGITDANPTFPLPNSRLSASNSLVNNLDLITENRAAANLLLDGAFNINSTSVTAWESVLGAMRDIKTEGHSLDTELRHNFARFNEPQMGVATNGESVPQLSNKDQLLTGYRNLTDAQIASLASEIVDEIRLRSATPDQNGAKYPFLSLSEFINRSPTSNNQAFALRGALQAAIDKANLNGLESDNTGLWAESAEYPLYYDSGDTPIIDRPKADGMPGAFMQSDLLAKIGAFIQARSDTFTIRSYGSSQEQFGSSEGSRAYYEMVVQRTPSYVDPSVDPDYVNEYGIPTQLTDTNEKFGRNYEIKSQRWVAADEI
jgi:hypothetical protein